MWIKSTILQLSLKSNCTVTFFWLSLRLQIDTEWTHVSELQIRLFGIKITTKDYHAGILHIRVCGAQTSHTEDFLFVQQFQLGWLWKTHHKKVIGVKQCLESKQRISWPGWTTLAIIHKTVLLSWKVSAGLGEKWIRISCSKQGGITTLVFTHYEPAHYACQPPSRGGPTVTLSSALLQHSVTIKCPENPLGFDWRFLVSLLKILCYQKPEHWNGPSENQQRKRDWLGNCALHSRKLNRWKTSRKKRGSAKQLLLFFGSVWKMTLRTKGSAKFFSASFCLLFAGRNNFSTYDRQLRVLYDCDNAYPAVTHCPVSAVHMFWPLYNGPITKKNTQVSKRATWCVKWMGEWFAFYRGGVCIC